MHKVSISDLCGFMEDISLAVCLTEDACGMWLLYRNAVVLPLAGQSASPAPQGHQMIACTLCTCITPRSPSAREVSTTTAISCHPAQRHLHAAAAYHRPQHSQRPPQGADSPTPLAPPPPKTHTPTRRWLR
jgi:hypothetical protein